MLDAVLFDYGGVFTTSPFHAVGAYGAKLGVAPQAIIETVFGSYEHDTDHPWHRLERGEVALGPAIEEIVALGRARGFEADPLEFFRAMGGGGIHEVVVACARELRAEGFRTALVTNNAAEFREHWRRSLPLDELFDVVVDSSEEGVRKPDPRIFERALERLGGVAPSRAAFLDDHPGNIAAAQGLGIRGVLVGPEPAHAVAELDALLGRGRARA
ncbi:MAG: HAD family phosphatase [Myxococcota bacterium]